MLQKSRVKLLHISNLAMQVQDDINDTQGVQFKSFKEHILLLYLLGCLCKALMIMHTHTYPSLRKMGSSIHRFIYPNL